MDIGIGFKTEWEVTLTDAKTSRTKLHLPWHKNTILDGGLNLRLTSSAAFVGYSSPYFMQYIAIGTSNQEPATTDVGLISEISRKQYIASICTWSTSTPGAPYFITGSQWGTSEGNGDLKEVGLVNASSNGTFWSRNLFRDAGGNPITVTKTSADILTIRCKITVVRASDTPYEVTLDGRTVKGVILNSGLSAVCSTTSNQSQWWTNDTFICATSNVDPAATQSNYQGTSLGTTTNVEWQAAHSGPSGGFYRECLCSIKSYQCNGNIGEIMAEAGRDNILWSRHTFNPVMEKDNTHQLDLTFRVTLSRV